MTFFSINRWTRNTYQIVLVLLQWPGGPTNQSFLYLGRVGYYGAVMMQMCRIEVLERGIVVRNMC